MCVVQFCHFTAHVLDELHCAQLSCLVWRANCVWSTCVVHVGQFTAHALDELPCAQRSCLLWCANCVWSICVVHVGQPVLQVSVGKFLGAAWGPQTPSSLFVARISPQKGDSRLY